MKSDVLYRLNFLFLALLLFAIVLGFKLYSVQIVAGEDFSKRADQQFFRPNYYDFDRGKIFFQDKNKGLIPAAEQKSGFLLALDPNRVSDPENLYEKVSSVIPLDKDFFMDRVGRNHTRYQEIARRLDIEQAEALREIGSSSLIIESERWRFYPGERMASHLVGFLAFQENDLAGRYGLEKQYEDILNVSNKDRFVNFFAEVFLNIRDSVTSGEETSGDVITTIDPLVQVQLERELEGINQAWGSQHSGAIIMDPQTGQIRAMASSPDFNPNLFREEDSRLFSNPLVENIFEMGSTIKALTIAAGLDSGSITPFTTFFDHGFVTLNNSTIFNFDGRSRGQVDMQEALNHSLNTGMAFIVNRMGNREFADYMFNFGLGERTGIDLPNEAASLVSNLESPRDLEYATASFGQGIALTPVATARALSVLGNGGTLVTPHIVERIDYKQGMSEEIVHEEGRRVITPETSEEITRMLVNTVDEALLGGSVKMERYSIAAKTGTAQIAKENERGYYDDRFLHSFFGYFPAYDPEFLIFIYSYDPKDVRYASETLTHPFMNMARFLINYYEIPPDR